MEEDIYTLNRMRIYTQDQMDEKDKRIKKLEETIEIVSPLIEYSEPAVYRNLMRLINREDLID